MHQTALITVTHDPRGRNIELFNRMSSQIKNIYGELFITVSDQSCPKLIETLENSPFHTKIIPKRGAADARRQAISFGLTGNSDYFHYCDFDRLLCWGSFYYDELSRVVEQIPQHDYLVIGRTKRAFETHPTEWKETERITNKICSLELGNEVDITAGSCAFSRLSATYIHVHSTAQMTDAEWAMIVHRLAKLNVDYIAVEGLQYHEDINGVNAKKSTAHVWYDRLRLSTIISETAIKTGKT